MAATGARAAQVPVVGDASPSNGTEPFLGLHQGGIATPQQRHTYFSAFDLTTQKSTDIVALLGAWTQAAARLTAGLTARPVGDDATVIAGDGGAALGLAPERLTLTFGFGPGLFSKSGSDRYGLSKMRPDALVDLPKFNGDQLDLARSGGDLSVQACADDAQVAFHAVRELSQIAYGVAQLRWAQSGFQANAAKGDTPRNLMGFKDGTNNPQHGAAHLNPDQPRSFDETVWASHEAPKWMQGGSYLVARRIRISLEHWERTPVDFQEEVIGRHKYSGAPIGKFGEFETLDLDRQDSEGNSVIADTAHVRLSAAATNNGAQILRRAYSYNDGAVFTAERWPPWRQGMMVDAGLFFLAYQRDPRTAFIPMFDTMAKMDAMNQFTTHTASAIFACPPGASPGGFIGQALFEKA